MATLTLYPPKIGDQIFFGSKATEPYHTGLVYEVDSKYVYTIEGNTSTSSGVIANGGCVCRKKYLLNYNLIVGYGRPNYDEKKETEETEAKVKITDGIKLLFKEVNSGIWGNEPERSNSICASLQAYINEVYSGKK